MNPEDEPTIAHNDSTPSFIEQARMKGWKAGLFNFGKGEQLGHEYFNPGLVRRPDGLWLLVRMSEIAEGFLYGKNKIWACRLSDNGRVPEGGPLLQFPDSGDDEQFEDPRAIQWGDQTWIGAVNFTWYADGSWTGAHQVLGMFKTMPRQSGPGDDDGRWMPLARRDPPVGTNKDQGGHTEGKHNKNWLWFFHGGSLNLLLFSDPWHIVQFGDSWERQQPFISDGVKWKHGVVRGGTPPILVGDHFFTFFHSSLPWSGRYRRYFMGAIAFEAQPPFRPTLWTQEPMLIGSQNDQWAQGKPLVVYPCGAVIENDRWFITMGINDLKCGWVEIPHEDVLAAVKSAPMSPGMALLAAPTERVQYDHIPYNGPYELGPTRATPKQPTVEVTAAAPTEGDRLYKPGLIGAPTGTTVQQVTHDPTKVGVPVSPLAPAAPQFVHNPTPSVAPAPALTAEQQELIAAGRKAMEQRARNLANLAKARAKAQAKKKK
jgi:predicted GH43/DUF377 family glycosyl hydrolase